MWGTSCVREMGCDTCCVIRAVLYAAVLDNHSILQICGNLNDCCQVFDPLIGFTSAGGLYMCTVALLPLHWTSCKLW